MFSGVVVDDQHYDWPGYIIITSLSRRTAGT